METAPYSVRSCGMYIVLPAYIFTAVFEKIRIGRYSQVLCFYSDSTAARLAQLGERRSISARVDHTPCHVTRHLKLTCVAFNEAFFSANLNYNKTQST